MEYDKNIANGAFRLWDDVVFTHEGAKMYCDSAYYYPQTNSLDAFENVYINQADTLHLYGEFLHYDGNTRIARVERNVRLINKETTLTTDILDFDLGKNVGYYTTGADIINGENNLKSILGYYYSRDDFFVFKDSVVVVNPDYTIYSDTLKYSSPTGISYFLGPTEIISDSNYIYCEDGWYNTQTDISMLKKNSYFKNSNQSIAGDSLYYERNTGFGEGFGNVEIIDIEQDIILRGEYAKYNETTENSLLTGKALFIQVQETDSIFVHADTLLSVKDTLEFKIVKGFYKVKLFRTDMQGKCDSMSYSTSDSIIRLYFEPVLWSDENQLTAEFIEIHTKNKQVDKMYLQSSAFIISDKDSSRFDQIKGKDMVCHFTDNQLSRIDVNGNGQTIYYPVDQEEIIGVNKAESSNMIIYMNEGKMNNIKFLTQPNAVLYPLNQLPPNESKLKDFNWLEKYRPRSKEEIFIWEP
ncbi:MAG: organic solvent tolerance protein OstA [Bacteroidales bacterium]|nr:organic solvent tolerance protein OstA [Bacteroidales bacterium]